MMRVLDDNTIYAYGNKLICYSRTNSSRRFLGDFCNHNGGKKFTTDSRFFYGDEGDIIYSINNSGGEELFNENELYYYTVVYDRVVSEEDDDYEFMSENNVDKISFFVNGELIGFTYYPKIGFDNGRNYWDVSDAYFQIGRCPIFRPLKLSKSNFIKNSKNFSCLC